MLRQILEAIDASAPDGVLFGLDDRATSVRETAYPSYKAGRAAKDPKLVDRLEQAAALLKALGLLSATSSLTRMPRSTTRCSGRSPHSESRGWCQCSTVCWVTPAMSDIATYREPGSQTGPRPA